MYKQGDQETRKIETYNLIRRAQQGDEAAKEEIIMQNTGLVKSVALKFLNMGCEWEDLMQIGFIGLVKAVMRFDFSYNLMFSTYAVPMIIGEIKRFLRDDGRVKVSRGIKTAIFKMKQARESFYAENGRYPKISELAERMETNAEQIIDLIEAEDVINNINCLDDPENYEKTEKSKSAHADEERMIDILSMKDAIIALNETDRKIILLRYQKDLTQQQVAKVLGTSQVQISRAEKRILTHMREEILPIRS